MESYNKEETERDVQRDSVSFNERTIIVNLRQDGMIYTRVNIKNRHLICCYNSSEYKDSFRIRHLTLPSCSDLRVVLEKSAILNLDAYLEAISSVRFTKLEFTIQLEDIMSRHTFSMRQYMRSLTKILCFKVSNILFHG